MNMRRVVREATEPFGAIPWRSSWCPSCCAQARSVRGACPAERLETNIIEDARAANVDTEATMTQTIKELRGAAQQRRTNSTP